jgi:DNA adenine methylase
VLEPAPQPVLTITPRPPGSLPKPILKWVGGKRQLLPALLSRLPASLGTYHEPFVGGGALFFRVEPASARLSDANAELMAMYGVVRDDLAGLLRELGGHVHNEAAYYAVRDWEPDGRSATAMAARTIYLNKTGFNGLYRVNSRGKFNVPFGRMNEPNFRDEPNLRACAKLLATAEITCCDFEATIAKAGPGDFIYCDPPYEPVSATSYFTAYQPGGFDFAEQERLARALLAADERGAKFLLSNSATASLRALYESLPLREHVIAEVGARRNVNANAANRGPVAELLVRNYRLVGDPDP